MAKTGPVSRKLSVGEAMGEAGLACLAGWFSWRVSAGLAEQAEPVDVVIPACALLFGVSVLVYSHAMSRVFRRAAESEGAFVWVYLVMRAFSVALLFVTGVVALAGVLRSIARDDVTQAVLPALWLLCAVPVLLANRLRKQRLESLPAFGKLDRRIKRELRWKKVMKVGSISGRPKPIGMRDAPWVALMLCLFVMIGVCLLITAPIVFIVRDRDPFAAVPLFFGCAFTVFPGYFLGRLIGVLRGRPLWFVVVLDRQAVGSDDGAGFARKELFEQAVSMVVLLLFALVPLALGLIHGQWAGFVFGCLVGLVGFSVVDIVREQLLKRASRESAVRPVVQSLLPALIVSGYLYGLVLLFGGLAVVAGTPVLVDGSGAGESSTTVFWLRIAVWLWVVLCGLSAFHGRWGTTSFPGSSARPLPVAVAHVLTAPLRAVPFINPLAMLGAARPAMETDAPDDSETN